MKAVVYFFLAGGGLLFWCGLAGLKPGGDNTMSLILITMGNSWAMASLIVGAIVDAVDEIKRTATPATTTTERGNG